MVAGQKDKLLRVRSYIKPSMLIGGSGGLGQFSEFLGTLENLGEWTARYYQNKPVPKMEVIYHSNGGMTFKHVQDTNLSNQIVKQHEDSFFNGYH